MAAEMLREQGKPQSAAHGSRAALRALVPRPLRSAIWWGEGRLGQAQQQVFERWMGVRTSGHVYLDELGLEDAGDDHTFYEACHWLPLRRALRDLRPGPDDVFVDLGSGLGQALLVAGRFPMKRVIGVDVVDELTRGAQRNIAAARPKLRCGDVEAVASDVLEWKVPDDLSVLFMYSPFTGGIFSGAMERVFDSFDRMPRPLRILYAFPWEHNRLLATGRVVVERVSPANWPAPPWWWRTGWVIVTYRVVPDGHVGEPPRRLPRRPFRPPAALERWAGPNDHVFRLWRPGAGFIKSSA